MYGTKITNETLIFLDEIQKNKFALTLLKPLAESYPQLHIVCVGSLLGLHKSMMPVGKVETLKMYPLTFDEYVLNKNVLLYEKIKADLKTNNLFIKNELYSLYKEYLVVGGLPEVVDSFIQEKDYEKVEKLLEEIFTKYKADFNQYSLDVNPLKIKDIYDSIPAQLANENSRFFIKSINKNARIERYEEANLWLEDAGLIHKVYLLENNAYPLIKNVNNNFYKLYLHDVGLLRHISQIHPSKIINEENFDWIGYLVKNFVLQQLKPTILNKSYYFKVDNNYEIDFLTQIVNDIIPIEVKSGKSKKKKSLTQYNNKFNPKYSIRFSQMDLKKDGLVINIPLWLISFVDFFNSPNLFDS